MLKLNTVLCPTDFSAAGGFAFETAAALAHDHGARLVILHVTQPMLVYGDMMVPPPEPTPEEWKEKMWETFHKLEKADPKVRELHVETRVAEGDPALWILETARDVEADMIVMGTHGRSGLTRLLMGSVAEEVLRKATCPVMTVKAGNGTLAAKAAPVAAAAGGRR
jgi:nucleotide-binding universal stress UspA family protein